MEWGDIAGNTGFQVAYPILNALLAGSSPRGYRAAQGLNVGLGIATKLAEQKKADTQDELLRQKLGDIFKAQDQTPAATLPASTTGLGLASEEAAGLEGLNNPPEATAATPSFASLTPGPTEIAPATSKPVFTPSQQKLGEALTQANRPDLALGIISRELFREPQQPHTFGSPETGYYTVHPDTGQPQQLIPGVGKREPTPPRPVDSAVGGTRVSRVYNPVRGQWETTETPLTAAPARELSPEQKRLMGAQTASAEASAVNARAEAGLRNQRRQDLVNAANDINNPKTDKNRLTTIYSGLLRRYDQLNKADPDEGTEDYADLQNVKVLIRSAEQRLQKEGGLTGNPSAPAKPRLKFDARGNPVK